MDNNLSQKNTSLDEIISLDEFRSSLGDCGEGLSCQGLIRKRALMCSVSEMVFDS